MTLLESLILKSHHGVYPIIDFMGAVSEFIYFETFSSNND